MVAVLSLAVGAYAAPTITNVGWGFTNVYAVQGDDGVILVDAHNPGNEDRILRRLEAAGIAPERLTLLVATHGHPDHAGSTAALADRLGIPVAGGAADLPYFASGTTELHPTGSRGRMISAFVRRAFPPVSLDLAVTDRLDLGPYGVAGELVVVGGHTPGSLIVDLHDGDVLSGDLIRSHLQRRHVPTLHFFHDDPVAASRALRTVVDGGATTLWPSHGGSLAAADVAAWMTRTHRDPAAVDVASATTVAP
ncbi:MAG: MBL fold metallo-hydrolase [Myxococcota bacterium]